MKFLFHMLVMAATGLVFIAACSSLKTRKDVDEEQKAQAAQEAEEIGPIDDDAINDGLAEMGVDPNQTTTKETPEPEVTGEVNKSEPAEMHEAQGDAPLPTPQPQVTPQPEVTPPPAAAPAAKATAKKSVAKKAVSKKVTKKTAKKPTKKTAKTKKTTKKKTTTAQ